MAAVGRARGACSSCAAKSGEGVEVLRRGGEVLRRGGEMAAEVREGHAPAGRVGPLCAGSPLKR